MWDWGAQPQIAPNFGTQHLSSVSCFPLVNTTAGLTVRSCEHQPLSNILSKKRPTAIFIQVKLKVPERLMLQSRHEDAICGRVDVWSRKRVKLDLRPGLERIGTIPLSQKIGSDVNKEKRINVQVIGLFFFFFFFTEVIK
jgi:hypothetical protein